MSLGSDTTTVQATATVSSSKLMATQQQSSSPPASPNNDNDEHHHQSTMTHAVLKRSFNPYFGGWSSPATAFGGPAKNPWNNGGSDASNGNEWAALGGSASAGLLDSWNG